jgi:N-acetylglucosamine-6-phosphate deacetylase
MRGHLGARSAGSRLPLAFGREADRGSIHPGALAGFVVLDDDHHVQSTIIDVSVTFGGQA